jgi:arylsulfatase
MTSVARGLPADAGAAAGDADVVDRIRGGGKIGDKSFKVHLDGNNLIPAFKGEAKEWPRKGFAYWSDDGDLMALRVLHWKVAFMEQDTETNHKTPLGVWQGTFQTLRAPNIYNLRADPFERATESIYYGDFVAHRMFLLVPAQAIVGKLLESFKEYPPRAKAASFTVGDAMDKIATASPNQN